MARVLVIGGGPAGSVFACRMAMLGHLITLLERDAVPQPKLGESLTPGVAKLLQTVGAAHCLDAAAPARRVAVRWGSDWRLREDPEGQGRIVDRRVFDGALLDHAASVGVKVRRPASALRIRPEALGWSVQVQIEGSSGVVEADLIAFAGGRRAMGKRRHLTMARTLALHTYHDRPRAMLPSIAAGEAGWCWSVPLPGGNANTLAFVDVGRSTGLIETRFRRCLETAGLGALAAQIRNGDVRATDATPAIAEKPIGPGMIRLGDAAMTLDPLSSSGVQKALQGALAGAAVAHTMLMRPGDCDLAARFYLETLDSSARAHADWAAGYYTQSGFDTPFWTARAGGTTFERRGDVSERALAEKPLILASGARIVNHPCIQGDFIVSGEAVAHPALDHPVAYVGETEIVPLLRRIEGPILALDLVRLWADRLPPARGLAIVASLVKSGVLSLNHCEHGA